MHIKMEKWFCFEYNIVNVSCMSSYLFVILFLERESKEEKNHCQSGKYVHMSTI